jgi:hypothetical protein
MPVSAISGMFSKTLQTDAGAAQTLIGALGMHKNQKNLDNLGNPVYTSNKPIADYYQTAKNRYETSPYNSTYYQTAEKTDNAKLGAGIGALGDRRSAVGQVGALVQGNENELGKAGVQAEAMQRQNFGQYGQAVGMKAGDDREAFQINQEDPFQRKYGELTQRLNNSRSLFNSGVNNLFGGLTGGGGAAGGIMGLPGAQGGSNGLGGGTKSTGGAASASSMLSPNSLLGVL